MIRSKLNAVAAFALTVCFIATELYAQSNSSPNAESTADSLQKQQVVALLKSIETGDQQAAAVINPNKYIQHNLAVADGLSGFADVLKALPAGSAKVNTVRTFQDGDFVFLHTEYNFFGPKIGFDIFRFEDGEIVEHWDNLQESPAQANPSGHTMIDGATKIEDLQATEANKMLVRKFVDDVLLNGRIDKLADYFAGDYYIQHNPQIADGLSGLGKALEEMAKQGVTMKYHQIHKVLGEGNFVLAVSEGEFAGKPTSFYDLFRVEKGKIAEHWDTIETIPPKEQWKNGNGKFSLVDELTIYVHAGNGSDQAVGTREQPLQSIPEAAKRVAKLTGSGPVSIVISEGLYALEETAVFATERSFTRGERLTIRADVLPDDVDWSPDRMPVIISTMALSNTWLGGRPDPFGGVSDGFRIETSHTTIQGLRILGSPVHEHPTGQDVRRNYPIARYGMGLEDLLVTQCMFLGAEHGSPCHLPILSNGHQTVVDHCVFSGCKMSVVFWRADGGPSRDCAMTNCLVHGAYGCGIWTVGPGEDFVFRNNVISDSLYAWIREGRQVTDYRIANSLFAGNRHLTGTGAGPLLNFNVADSSFLKFDETLVTEESVQLEFDQTSRNYLHIKSGTMGADIGAGLFVRSPIKAAGK